MAPTRGSGVGPLNLDSGLVLRRWWKDGSNARVYRGVGMLFTCLDCPLIRTFVVLVIASYLAPAQTHTPFEGITKRQPTELSSQAPNVSSPESNRKSSAAKYDAELIGPRARRDTIDLYALEKEHELGRRLARDVEANSKLIVDPAIDEYVNRLGQRIVLHSDAQVPFTIKVIESNDINAFALPGGYLYVDSGLILAADNEAELAALMAHEVAHVAARHDSRMARQKRIWTLMTYCSGPAGGPVKLAGYLWSMKLRRRAEREADFLGLEYQYATGYDPLAFVEFFERLHREQNEKDNFIAKALVTHPMTEDRIRRAEQELSTLLPPRDESVVDTSDFREVKSRLADIMRGAGKSEGGRPVLRRHGNEDSRPLIQ